MKTYDVVIIGAGISGLSLAHYSAKAGLSTLVLEKSDRPGGSFHSHRFGGEAEGFWLELGAHTCYNSYGRLIGLMEECSAIGKLIPREKAPFKLLVEGALKSIPSRLSFFELALSLPRMLTAKKAGETMESYYSKILGKGNYKKALGPVFDAIISQDAGDFPADMLFKKRAKRKDVLGSFTLTAGLSTITDTVALEPGVTLLTGQDVSSIELSGAGFTIAAGGERYHAGYLALAVPLRSLTRRLPHGLLAALCRVLDLPLVAYTSACRYLPLPMRDYMNSHLSRLSPEVRRLTIYDQLNPAWARYYRRAEAVALLENEGFVDVRVHHRHGYSWTVVGTKP